MYDTVKLWLPSQNIAGYDYHDRVPNLLNNPTLHTKDSTQYVTGSIEGLNTLVSVNGISIQGSITKFYLKDNIKTLTRQDTERAFEMLSDYLNIPVFDAYINRIDVAYNLLVDNKPELYYPYLGESTKYKRLLQPNSVYWSNSQRTKLVYNKKAEVKNKGVAIPEIWKDKNVIRYELRYMSRLPKQFNCCKVQVKNLYEECFYIDIIDRWLKEYESINKLNEIKLNFDKMKKPKDFITQMALLKISEIGQNETLQLIDQLKAKKCFAHKEYYCRLKSDIKRLSKAYTSDQSNELIEELNNKIRYIKKHYR